MPKIIEEVKERLLAEAKRQTLENGYSNMTVRSVVSACGVSIGTFYNYYSSKEALTAAFMLEDWIACLNGMRAACDSSDGAMDAIELVYAELLGFEQRYAQLFSDKTARSNAASEIYARHGQLRSQLSALLREPCSAQATYYTDFLPDFIAEALITWSLEGKAFDELRAVIGVLFGD